MSARRHLLCSTKPSNSSSRFVPFPTRGGTTEIRRKRVVIRHRKEPDVDLSLSTEAHEIDRGLMIS